MIPVLGGEVEEGEQRFPVLREAGNGLIILGVVFVSEHIDRYLGRRAGWRAVDLAKVDLHVDLDREGDLVQYVGGLVNPTPLVSGARKDLLDRLPEAERAVADREVRRNLEPTLLHVDEKLAPALCVLTYPGLEADEFLLALGCCADQHQHALGGFFHSGLQIDPVRPHVHVSPRREVALLPGVVICLPFCCQPRDHRRTGNSASRLFVRRAHFGRIDEVKRILSSAPTSPRSRTLARRTSTGPTPVWIARYGPWPWRTTRSRPSGNFKSFHMATKESASAIST